MPLEYQEICLRVALDQLPLLSSLRYRELEGEDMDSRQNSLLPYGTKSTPQPRWCPVNGTKRLWKMRIVVDINLARKFSGDKKQEISVVGLFLYSSLC